MRQSEADYITTEGAMLAPTEGAMLAPTEGAMLAPTEGAMLAPTEGAMRAPTALASSLHSRLEVDGLPGQQRVDLRRPCRAGESSSGGEG